MGIQAHIVPVRSRNSAHIDWRKCWFFIVIAPSGNKYVAVTGRRIQLACGVYAQRAHIAYHNLGNGAIRLHLLLQISGFISFYRLLAICIGKNQDVPVLVLKGNVRSIRSGQQLQPGNLLIAIPFKITGADYYGFFPVHAHALG